MNISPSDSNLPRFIRHAKLLLEREIESRHSSFDQGKKVPGCNGAREISIRLLGIKVIFELAELRCMKGLLKEVLSLIRFRICRTEKTLFLATEIHYKEYV